MEVSLESFPTGIGLRRSIRPMEKPAHDHVMIIDLEDEIEEEEEWEPEPVSSTPKGGIAKKEDEGLSLTSSQEKVPEMQIEVDANEGLGLVGTVSNPISSWPIFPKNIGKKVEEISLEEVGTPSQEIGLVGSNHDKRDLFALGTDEDAFWQEVIDLDPSKKDTVDCSTIDVDMQQTDFIDLSSSESGDDGEDGIGDVAEEEEEIITTLSREDAALLAEVMKAIKEGGDLNKFRIESLKTYLRHHGLRMVGLKAVLLNRIQEHLKIKDGRAEMIYPRSSFSIDCTGDVCLGDTVLFRQTVYDTPFDIERRCASGPPLGQRWVAGKVVNESYGAGKQQHTFTIEVLWSTGTKPFYVMRPLRIKGRNLYRMTTRRQVWPNEAERKKVLDEKHARGAEARAIRRAVKSLKSKGKLKSRQDARVHPYLRSHTTEPHNVLPIPPQNSVQYASIHTQDNVHQGSVPNPSFPARTPVMQHESYIERAVYQGFTKRFPAPEPISPRGRDFHSQQNHHEGFTKRFPAPKPISPRGRDFHSQQNHHEGFTKRFPAPKPISPRGRDFHSQQNHHEGFTKRFPAPKPISPRGRDFHSQQNHHEGFTKRFPAPKPISPRGRDFHSQQNHHEGFTKRFPAPKPISPRGRGFHSQQNHHEGFTKRFPAPKPISPRGRGFHSQQNHHEGFTKRFPAPKPTSPRGRDFHSQQNHHEGFTKRFPAPKPISPRGRDFHSQQNHHEGFTEIHPALGPSVPRARNFHSQQNRYEGSTQAHHVPLRIHVQESMQHRRIYTQRQVSDGGMASQMPVHPNRGRQQGPVTIPCSNAGCEKFGAKQCISRSCPSCCRRNSTRGRCPRHR